MTTHPCLARTPVALDHPRPFSDSVTNWRNQTSSLPVSPNKRATWNGTQVSPLASIKSLRRKANRQSELNPLFLVPDTHPASAPPSPLTQRPLKGVKEEEDPADSDSELPYTREKDVFGIDALNLQRKRRSSGMETFGIPPPSYSSQTLSHQTHQSLSSFASDSHALTSSCRSIHLTYSIASLSHMYPY